MKLSENGKNFIKSKEQLRLKVYLDAGKLPTIGWGHLIKKGENYTEITLKKANELFDQDISTAENAVNNYVKYEITQNQFDALCSFAYNIGINAFKNSTLLSLIKNENN